MAGSKATAEKSEVTMLQVERLVVSDLNPRRTTSEGSDAELAESVRRLGILVPLIVRPADSGDGFYEVLAGSRRLKAARAAGLFEIPCSIVRHKDAGKAAEIAVVDNLQREDVHPLEEADSYQRLMQFTGGDVKGVCDRVSKPISYVLKRLALTGLVEKGRNLLLNGEMDVSGAMQVARLDAKCQKEVLRLLADHGQGYRAKEVSWVIGRWIMSDIKKVPWDPASADLLPDAGPCTSCPKRTGSAPDLFSDVTGDRCADVVCFNQKKDAHIKAVFKKLKAKGEKAVGICDSWTPQIPKGAIQSGSWTPAGKKECPKTMMGVHLDGQKFGRVTKVCTQRDNCEIHGRSFTERIKLSPAERTKRRNERLKLEREKRTRAGTLKAIHEMVTPGLAEMRQAAKAFFDRIWHDAKKRFINALGWEFPKKKKGQYGADWSFVEKRIDAMTVLDVSRFLYAGSLAGELDPRFKKNDVLRDTAKSFGIDLDPIIRGVDEAMKPKPRKSGKRKAKDKKKK